MDELPLARVVIEGVRPQLDGGRHPIKRCVGDLLEVGADIFKDGHDRIGARIAFRPQGERTWRHEPLVYHYEPDRWTGSVSLDRMGRWQYTIEAWADRWGTWREDLRKRLDAGQEVASELLEGAVLLRLGAEHRGGKARQHLERAAAVLENSGADLDRRIQVALEEEVAALLEGPLEPEDLTRWERVLEVIVDRERARFGAWYEVFPRSLAPESGRHGTFADAERHLPRLAELGFDVVYLPPIHPIGRTHRKGRNNTPGAGPDDVGSPWAIGGPEGGHTAVHPELGTLADFERFVDRAKNLGLEVALDYALQCSPDHPWAREHPEWFHIRPDGSIRYAENPPKKYQDIYPLHFWCADREGLWNACVDVLRFWIARGVRIFRVDNPHTKPFVFWEWAIREIQRDHPDVIFLAEAFTRPKRMYGLAKLGFTQSYTFFTWKNAWWELQDYLTELVTETPEFFRPNFFANTPDILHEYLQRGGRPAFRVRLLLAATLSPSYGIYSGFELCENVPVREGSEEYLHSEKYEIRHRDWNAPGSLDAEIARINRIRRESPALQRLANLTFLPSENPQILCYRKSHPGAPGESGLRSPGGEELLVAVNLDPHGPQESWVHLPLEELGLGPDEPFTAHDLLTGERFPWRESRNYLRLDPRERAGHVLRLEAEPPGGSLG